MFIFCLNIKVTLITKSSTIAGEHCHGAPVSSEATQQRKRPIVLSIVICQGHSGWGTEFRPIEHFVPYKNHQHIFPDLRFTIIDLTTMADDKIRGTSYLRILFLTLKYIHNPVLPEKIRDIIVIFKELNDDPEAPENIKALMKYLEELPRRAYFLSCRIRLENPE